MSGLLAHFPQPVVGREIGIVMAMGKQTRTQQAEMARLVIGAADPVGAEAGRQAAETVDRSPARSFLGVAMKLGNCTQ